MFDFSEFFYFSKNYKLKQRKYNTWITKMDMELLETDSGGMSQLVFIILFFVSVYLCQRNVVVKNELVKKKNELQGILHTILKQYPA